MLGGSIVGGSSASGPVSPPHDWCSSPLGPLQVWVLQGATYEGYRRYLQQAKEQGFPEPPRPPHDAIELARLPTAASLEAAPPPAAPSASALPPYSLLHSFGGRGGAAVSVVKFAPGSSDLLAWGGADGAVHVATAEGQPRLLQVRRCCLMHSWLPHPAPGLGMLHVVDPSSCTASHLQVLERHAGRVTDLDWAPDGTLLSCAEDGTACLWRPEAAQLLRTLRNGSGPLCCCRFHPSNPGLLLLGTAAGELLALNASTGAGSGCG